MWDNVTKGGIIVFDEYGYHSWSESKGVDKFIQEKNLEIKNKRIEYDNKTIFFKGHEIDADFEAKLLLKNAYDLMRDEDVQTWKIHNNDYMQLKKIDMFDLVMLIADRTREVFAHEGYLNMLIAQCNTKEELENILWEV
jgi:hypothetical protein